MVHPFDIITTKIKMFSLFILDVTIVTYCIFCTFTPLVNIFILGIQLLEVYGQNCLKSKYLLQNLLAADEIKRDI